MCTYNGEAFLPVQLASIAAQTRLPDEMIIRDDGSSDATLRLVDEFAKTAGFPVRVIRNEVNLRSTKNFEAAISDGSGDLIVTADQDDRWRPEKLKTIEAVFENSPKVGLVFTDATLIDGDGQSLGVSLWSTVKFRDDLQRMMIRNHGFDALLRRQVVTGATMAFRASFRDLVLPIPPSWVHDEWIAILIAAVAEIRPIVTPLMEYRRHAHNQVGVAGITPMERTRRSLNSPFAYFEAKAEDYGQLRQRIAEKLPERPDLLARIDGKIRHYRARSAMPTPRLLRLPTVLGELVSLRYTRYSGHTLSFLRDIMAGAS